MAIEVLLTNSAIDLLAESLAFSAFVQFNSNKSILRSNSAHFSDWWRFSLASDSEDISALPNDVVKALSWSSNSYRIYSLYFICISISSFKLFVKLNHKNNNQFIVHTNSDYTYIQSEIINLFKNPSVGYLSGVVLINVHNYYFYSVS